ncbi:PA2169 family four-helix-bundle protein [Coralloluteibacterium stylophorae]|uniref:PA2169 family four-helix-bundle protein n=1 Tax=Coralloluteibacterium stylophorae TaxID=1776034 RepID=A0A8J7VU58_9GAMM|nr:PA2169 family four-helix-bundle protein [Coralloluteibacterium stylophorae]MBS7455844.1 PA2169 family four-helix-bundle protein [Coralloluteibacterium stylophorae]
MSKQTTSLNDLIDVLEDSRDFYRDAAGDADHAQYKQLFERMAATKASIAGELKTKVAALGATPSDGSVGGSLRKGWGEMRAKLSKNSDVEYISQLEEFEDRIVHAFREAVNDSEHAEVRAIAQKYQPQVEQDHAQMRDLKHSLGRNG